MLWCFIIIRDYREGQALEMLSVPTHLISTPSKSAFSLKQKQTENTQKTAKPTHDNQAAFNCSYQEFCDSKKDR